MAERWILRQGTSRADFRYVGPSGAPVRDRRTLARIESLRVPPAWRHVRIEGRRAVFTYLGKGGTRQRQLVTSPELVRLVARLLRTPGARLFRFRGARNWRDLTASMLITFLREHLGPYAVKDFRTWGGPLGAATVLAEFGPPRSALEAKRNVALAMRIVASELGNTPAICRSPYVHPIVLARYLDEGDTIALGRGPRSAGARVRSWPEPPDARYLPRVRPSRQRAVLAIDEGTTGVTCLVVGEDGRVLARAYGITNRRETIVVWDRRTGNPVHRAIVWQDRRTAQRCAELAPRAERVRELAGLVIDPYFSGTKLEWLLRHVSSGEHLAAGTMDSWLIWRLTDGAVHATDHTNASRTMLCDIREKRWSDELCELLSVPRRILPEVRPSSGDFGTATARQLGQDIPIRGVAGDQQAALYGQGCWAVGAAKNTYGTGAFLLLNTGETRARAAQRFHVFHPEGSHDVELLRAGWGRAVRTALYWAKGGSE